MIRTTEEKKTKKATVMTCVFADVGGVLLTDGWDHHARKRAAKNFKLEFVEMEDRHQHSRLWVEQGELNHGDKNAFPGTAQ